MNVTVNGELKSIKKGSYISGLLSAFSIKPEAVVVELNLKIISKELWDTTILKENDKVEIVRFVGGG
ncbi:MAG: sulfur carrier protein ThiS [Candidatus Margulisbacteria bacterium]|nr:sulfur carrier protein ThiS [Candidatus Margulisiibacteriota bacterium]